MADDRPAPVEQRRGDPRSLKAKRIIAAAEEVFIDEGMTAFSLRRVASVATMRLSTLQYYFPTIEDLLSATIKSLMATFNVRVEELVNAPTDATARQTAILDFLLGEVRKPRTARLMFEAFAIGQRNAAARTAVDTVYEEYRTLLARLITPTRTDIDATDRAARGTLMASILDGLLIYASQDANADPAFGSALRRHLDAVFQLLATAK